ncbi:protein kinase G-activating protein GlnX [Sphaerisporangium flaviroseum]|uniref:Protein kinase G-activating protein GlnX n=1 Tax=Sphaerisporangium flaviroseum TaxID=509199 RepID=A0ABP7JJF9_9ACTN
MTLPAPAPVSPAPATVPAPAESPSPQRRVKRTRTVPGRIRILVGLAVAAVLLLFTTVSIAIGHARDGLTSIGHTAGPQVVATADLYFALSDMDGQIANLLLTGTDSGLGPGRQAMLDRYDEARSQADRAVLQAADLASDDATEQTTVRALLDGLGRYERLASRALVLDEQAGHAAGAPPQEVLDVYRQATDLMRLDLLPKAYNLTLDSGTIVRHSYLAELSAVQAGRVWVGLTGALAILVLLALQIFLTRGFRRILNVPLLVATIVVAGLTVAGVVVLQHEGNVLTEAKEDGFNSVLALSRARAIGNTLHGDESRYLLDPQRADTYEQVYLDKSQAVLYLPGGNLDKYYAAVDAGVAAFPGKADFLGFYGSEASHITLPGQRDAITKVLGLYRSFQQNDRQIRRFATSGRQRDAVRQVMGPAFGAYDEALVDLTALHRKAFDSAVREGDDALGGWNVVPPAAALAAILLILIGVRPRLAEYR